MNTNLAWDDKTVEDPRNVDLAVVIGRFNPGPHNGHMTLLRKAEALSRNRLCLIGSAFIARDTRNPFNYHEREQMLSTVLDSSWTIRPVMDHYNNQSWIGDVQSRVSAVLERKKIDPKTARVVLVGYRKDVTSEYLDYFPKYLKVLIEPEVDLDATTIRNHLFDTRYCDIPNDVMPLAVENWIKNWVVANPEIYENLCGEFSFMESYKSQFRDLKYPPKFVCVDSTVICHGHVLMVKRRSFPGKGLWALPGGHLNDNEFIIDGILRELEEETKIKMGKEALLECFRGPPVVFDAPKRSLRGRTISHNGLFILTTPTLPKVKGSDDAEKAKWIPFSEFYGMSEQMFEDHYNMVTYMIGRAG